MANHGLKPTVNSQADFVRPSPATGSEIFEGWLPRMFAAPEPQHVRGFELVI